VRPVHRAASAGAVRAGDRRPSAVSSEPPPPRCEKGTELRSRVSSICLMDRTPNGREGLPSGPKKGDAQRFVISSSIIRRSCPSASGTYWRWTRRSPPSSRCVTVRDRGRPDPLRIEGPAEEHDLLAVERGLASPDRHACRSRVGPHAREEPRFRLETDQTEADGLPRRPVELELRLKETTLVDHRLAAAPGRARGLAGARVERLHDVPVSRELLEKFLPGAGAPSAARRRTEGRAASGRSGKPRGASKRATERPCDEWFALPKTTSRTVAIPNGRPPAVLHVDFSPRDSTPKCQLNPAAGSLRSSRSARGLRPRNGR
jgi:hypothetical protein